MKRQVKRLMAYFYMPLIFTVIGYAILYVACAPVIELASTIGTMILVKDVPSFQTELGSIYEGVTFQIDSQPETVSVKEVEWPTIGKQYGKLSCDRIGLETPVYFGDSNAILKNGAGQYHGTFLPGYGKPIMLCAHNTTFFAPLQNVETGDIFTFTTNYGIYQYQVTGTRIADHNDSTAYDLLQDNEQLIMYTCYPFERMVGTKTDRLFVYADKIAGPVVVD